MGSFYVYYEFPLTRNTIEGIIEDIGINKQRQTSVVDELFDYLKRGENLYARVEIPDKPGVLMQLVQNYQAQGLPHPIDGIKATVHSGSEGYLAMEWFRPFMRASLEKREIPYTPYDKI
jgi:hypothetical protein